MLMGFLSNEQAGDCVAAIIANGIIPGGLEMMDKPAIVAAEDFCHPGYPQDVEGLLICELDGPEAEVLHLIELVGAIARQCGATVVRISEDEAERQRFWLGRKSAFPAVGLARLLLHGRHHPARAAAQRARAHARAERALWPARRERVPRRRRQSASAHPVRRNEPGSSSAPRRSAPRS